MRAIAEKRFLEGTQIPVVRVVQLLLGLPRELARPAENAKHVHGPLAGLDPQAALPVQARAVLFGLAVGLSRGLEAGVGTPAGRVLVVSPVGFVGKSGDIVRFLGTWTDFGDELSALGHVSVGTLQGREFGQGVHLRK